MKQLRDMKLVGRDGNLWLFSSADGKTGILYDSLRDSSSKPGLLQMFFKWGNFEKPTENDLRESGEKKTVPSNEIDGRHTPLYVDAACPLCGDFGADYYAGHKGLLVCRSCGKTFDPSVEP